MAEIKTTRSAPKIVLLVLFGFLLFTLLFVLACRIAVQQIFSGIEQSRGTGLAAVAWDQRSMWSQADWSGMGRMLQKDSDKSSGSQISRNAELQSVSRSFDESVREMNRTVAAHQGYLEDLRTESRSREGRMLFALISVPAPEFDFVVSELRHIGRVQSISVGGEDAAVKLDSAARRVTIAQTNLDRLRKLQRDHSGVLRDALELEKEIRQANQAVADAEREHDADMSTVARSRIQFALMEEYRAPFEVNLAGLGLRLRNALVDGTTASLSSAATFVEVAFAYGMPLLFWVLLLQWPVRLGWRRMRAHRLAAAKA